MHVQSNNELENTAKNQQLRKKHVSTVYKKMH